MQNNSGADDIFNDIDFDAIDVVYEQKHEQPPVIKPRNARILGGAVILSAVCIIIAAVFLIAGLMKQKSLHDQKSMQLAQFVKPIVEADMQPFGSINEADSLSMLKACTIYVIENDSAQLKSDASGSIIIPLYLMKSAACGMFGEDADLSYYSFDINGILFEYDSENKRYLFSAAGFESEYTPKIVSYSEKDGRLKVLVKYLSENERGEEQYTYEIAENSGSFTVISIKK